MRISKIFKDIKADITFIREVNEARAIQERIKKSMTPKEWEKRCEYEEKEARKHDIAMLEQEKMRVSHITER